MAKLLFFLLRVAGVVLILWAVFSVWIYHDLTHIFKHSNLSPRTETNFIVIHHDDIPYESDVASVDDYHANHNNWGSGFAYHFYIDASGISQVRRIDKASAAQLDHNWESVSICLNGNFDTQEPTPCQLIMLDALVYFLKWKYPDAKVVSHSNLNETNCCGKYLKDYITKYQ